MYFNFLYCFFLFYKHTKYTHSASLLTLGRSQKERPFMFLFRNAIRQKFSAELWHKFSIIPCTSSNDFDTSRISFIIDILLCIRQSMALRRQFKCICSQIFLFWFDNKLIFTANGFVSWQTLYLYFLKVCYSGWILYRYLLQCIQLCLKDLLSITV